MNVKIIHECQKFSPDALITLFEFDGTSVGLSDILYFTSSAQSNQPIGFKGHYYIPLDIIAEGFDFTSQGTLPSPRIKMSNVLKNISAITANYEDLIGCKVTRVRTFGRFLDNGTEPDDEAAFPNDYFYIERKVTQNNVYIEWELSASIDQQNRFLPKRQILRMCPRRYRRWNSETNTFDYSKAECPYTGAACFDTQRNLVEPRLDRCGKTIDDCKKRFGNEKLPFQGFPSVGKTRV